MNKFKVTQKGFTLIELLVTVTIVGILLSFAIPNYQDYVIRGKLQEGTSELSAGRVRMEQFYQDNRTYVGAPCPAATRNFNFGCGVPTATTYTITATGLNNLNLFSYTINQQNTKSTTGAIAGWGATPANCWHVKRGGSC